jgi:Tfp pilus assembly protein PilO
MHADNHRHLSGTTAAVLIFSFAMLITLALIRFIVKPHYESFFDNHDRLVEMKIKLQGHIGADALKTRLMAQQDSLVEKYDSLSRHFGEMKDLPGVLRMLIEKANAADIQFVKMQPYSERAAAKAASYPIVLELTASYHSLGRFISSLESVPHMVHVDRLAITAIRNSMLDIRIQLSCNLFKNG